MMDSNGLIETAQNGVAQIVEHHAQVEAKSVRHFRLSTLWFFAGLMLFFGGNAWLQSRLETRLVTNVGQPGDPVVKLLYVPVIDNPVVCPGESFSYTLSVDIVVPSVVTSDAVIKNLDTGRTEMLSEPLHNIFEETGHLSLGNSYTLPMLLPATRNLPERPWKAGNYRRVLALTGEEGEKKSSIVVMDFRVGAHCPGLAK